MKKTIALLLMTFFTMSLSAQGLDQFFKDANVFLNTHVKNGLVDYKGISKSKTSLNNLMQLAESVTVKKSDSKRYQAFWINAYNLSVIKGLVDQYPIKSPLNDKGFFDKTTYQLAGQKVTLNTIENKMLRAQFKDARFHFVLVCGAIGCPPIINKAYLPQTLESQLQSQTKKAINGSFITISTKKKRVVASEILKWYKEDFVQNNTTEIDFLNQFLETKIPSDYKLTYGTYNWNINKQ